MLTNLLSNAFRYTPPGGQVEVAVVAVSNTARITVHDTGPGIPLDAMPFIFERFYRADKSRSRSEGGQRLGLGDCAYPCSCSWW